MSDWVKLIISELEDIFQNNSLGGTVDHPPRIPALGQLAGGRQHVIGMTGRPTPLSPSVLGVEEGVKNVCP